MTSAPFEPGLSGRDDETDVPAGDLGAGGPAEDAGSEGGPLTPPQYPEQVDPAEGPVGDRAARRLGDLIDPGAR